MDQLIRMVQDRAGIDENQARRAAETVLGFLKQHLPGPVANQLDGALKGGAEGDRREGGMPDDVPDVLRHQQGNPLA